MQLANSLDTLQSKNKLCEKCALRKGCNQVVTGIGTFVQSIMLVGEAPGKDEDTEGEPFVGRSGQLLRKILTGANIQPKDIYITNTVKCRPPNNRVPTPIEIQICKTWLWQEIKLLQPKIIVPLGGTSAKLLLRKQDIKISDVAGIMLKVDYVNAKIMPWFHPSYLVRNNGRDLFNRSIQWFIKIREQLDEV